MPLIEIASGIGQNVAASAVVALLRDLVGVQDQQLKMLQAIRQDVKTLIDGPWRLSQQMLDMAAYTTDADLRRRYLADAKAALFKAHSHEPAATPRRATVAVDLAMVLGLLAERDTPQLWARKAYDDQAEAVAAAAPQVQRRLNSTVPALKVFVDGDFWELVNRSRKHDPDGAAVWLRERYEEGLDEPASDPSSITSSGSVEGSTWAGRRENLRQLWLGVSGLRGAGAANEERNQWLRDSRSRIDRGEMPRRWSSAMSHIAIAGTTTEAGRRLMQLHRMRWDAQQYRQVCLALNPQADVPEYRLFVDLSGTRRASIRWVESP
jgi:hypothetical protein